MKKIILKHDWQDEEVGVEVFIGNDPRIYRSIELTRAVGWIPDVIIGALNILNLIVILLLILGYHVNIVLFIPLLCTIASSVEKYYSYYPAFNKGELNRKADKFELCRWFTQYTPIACNLLLFRHIYYLRLVLLNIGGQFPLLKLYESGDVLIFDELQFWALDIVLVVSSYILSTIYQLYYMRENDVHKVFYNFSTSSSIADRLGLAISLVYLILTSYNNVMLYHRFLDTLPLVFLISQSFRVFIHCCAEILLWATGDADDRAVLLDGNMVEYYVETLVHSLLLGFSICFVVFRKRNISFWIVSLIVCSILQQFIFSGINIRLIRRLKKEKPIKALPRSV